MMFRTGLRALRFISASTAYIAFAITASSAAAGEWKPVPSLDPGPISAMACSDDDICVYSKAGIFCSSDRGARWAYISVYNGTPNLAMAEGYLYATPVGIPGPDTLDIYDLRIGSWFKSSWVKPYSLGSILLLAHDSRVMAYAQYMNRISGVISRDRGKTWDTLSAKQRGPVGGPNRGFMSRDLWGVTFNHIVATQDDGLHWTDMPDNPKARSTNSDKVAAGSRIYVPGDTTGIWAGDLDRKSWSLVEGTETMRVNHLCATESALYADGSLGLFRLDLDSIPDGLGRWTDSDRIRSGFPGGKARVGIPAQGPWRRIVTPAGSRHAYDFSGAETGK
jgi:hypothetical protein